MHLDQAGNPARGRLKVVSCGRPAERGAKHLVPDRRSAARSQARRNHQGHCGIAVLGRWSERSPARRLAERGPTIAVSARPDRRHGPAWVPCATLRHPGLPEPDPRRLPAADPIRATFHAERSHQPSVRRALPGGNRCAGVNPSPPSPPERAPGSPRQIEAPPGPPSIVVGPELPERIREPSVSGPPSRRVECSTWNVASAPRVVVSRSGTASPRTSGTRRGCRSTGADHWPTRAPHRLAFSWPPSSRHIKDCRRGYRPLPSPDVARSTWNSVQWATNTPGRCRYADLMKGARGDMAAGRADPPGFVPDRSSTWNIDGRAPRSNSRETRWWPQTSSSRRLPGHGWARGRVDVCGRQHVVGDAKPRHRLGWSHPFHVEHRNDGPLPHPITPSTVARGDVPRGTSRQVST
jgi:hypothetical protein